ncbi:MAG TPA: flagellin, partial [Candidatus Aquilonibacter sp.]
PPYINIANPSNTYQYVAFLPNNITPDMVGQSAVFTWTPAQNYQQGSGLTVNTGDAEGSTITIQIGAADTYNLGIAGITVGDTLTNQASEALLNNALQEITTQQAQVGAQTVALGIAATNNATYNVNIAASASEITDLNIGQASTQYTQTQILVNVGTSVLAQMQTGERQLTALLITALVA